MAETAEIAPPSAALPAELTTFVGRRSERNEIRSLLSETRLVTLTGFGGMGKTRLALRVAADLRRAFADGVFFVSLGAKDDPEWLPHDIATQLGLQGRSTKAAPTSLVEYLSTRSVLLVLDNCEHLVDAVAMLTDTLLRTCPHLRVLVTSREPLRIQGESVHQVAPLSTPPRNLAPDEPLQGFESVALFLDRARQVLPDFDVTPDNRETVAELCTALEGIPLAIELAAARLRAQSPAEIHRQLSDHWDSLNRGSRTAPDRQRTMAGCIEWSFGLCSEAEQQLWARAAVFAEGFELDAVRTVCPDDGDPDPLDTLMSLVDKSIVTAAETRGRTRYRMLPPIRQRGLTRLRETGELTDLRLRHRDWAVGLAQQAAAEWVGPDQVRWIHRLRAERGNMDAALEFCASEPGEAAPGLVMGSALQEFGLADGLFRPGRIWFDQLLQRAPEPTEIRARALRTACWWATMQGDLEGAVPLLQEGLRIAATYGGLTATLLTQAEAFVAMFSGDVERAATLFDEAVEGFVEAGEISQAAHTYALMALNHSFRGKLDEAMAAHQSCMAITEPAGESWYRAYSMWIAGLAAWLAGDAAEATRLQKDSLRLKRPMGDRLGIGTSLEALAWLDVARDPRRSAVLLGAAQHEWDRIETSTEALPGLAVSHHQCVDAAVQALGEEQYAEAFAEGRAMHHTAAVSVALEETPAAATGRGRGRAKAARTSKSNALTPREQEIAELVQRGLNNKEIAETLVISKRTAETHVEHILTKLGFTNRNQIAAWVGEQLVTTGDEPTAPPKSS